MYSKITIMYKKLRKLAIWKKLLILLVLGVIVFVGWFVYAIVTDAPPSFFPLDNPRGEYKITRNCPNGQGWTEQFQGQGYAYCVEYRGPDVFMNDESGNTNFFRITVGKSNIGLEQFVGKQVRIVKGKYVSSSKQCIKNNCVNINGPYVVLNIDNLELVENQ
jgi:hypothetical protein